MGGGGGGKSAPEVQEAPAPTVSQTAPVPEPIAEAPKLTESATAGMSRAAKRQGSSALRIDLNLGGNANGASGTSGNGLNIP